jgi:hypothetical protein
METQLKIEGKYEQYAKDLMNANKNAFVTDYEQAVEEYSNAKDDTFVCPKLEILKIGAQ